MVTELNKIATKTAITFEKVQKAHKDSKNRKKVYEPEVEKKETLG